MRREAALEMEVAAECTAHQVTEGRILADRHQETEVLVREQPGALEARFGLLPGENSQRNRAG